MQTNRKRYGAVLALGLVLLPACLSRWEKIELAAQPAANSFPDRAGVVLLDEVSARFVPNPSEGAPVLELTRHRRVRILREAGESLAHVGVAFQPGIVSLVSFEARTIAPDGKERTYSRRDASDVPAHPSFIMYADTRALVLDAKPAMPGTIVETKYTVRFEDSLLSSVTQSFGDSLPTKLARLVVRVPAGAGLEHRATELNEEVAFAPTVETRGQERWYTWERRDIPAVSDEKLAPDAYLLSTLVSARLTSWQQRGALIRAPRDTVGYSAWLATRVKAPDGDAATTAMAKKIVGTPLPDPEERARRLYGWVRDTVSYCAIEIGQGGWRPHPPSDVLKFSYGDCKDKANLLRVMLSAVEVPSRLVEIYHHNGFPTRFHITSGARFNHAILAIDLPGGKTVFADPTSRTVPFGELPIGDQEADLLPISASGEALVRSTPSAPENNTDDLRCELEARNDVLEGTFVLTRSGDLAARLRGQLIARTEDDRQKIIADATSLVAATTSAVTFDGAAPPDRAQPIVARGRVQLRIAIASGATQVVSLARIVASVVPVLPAGARKAPLVLSSRRRTSQRISLVVPESLEVSLPAPQRIERPYGTYEQSWKVEGRTLLVERTLTMGERIFPASAYADVRAFFDEILAAEARGATLRKRTR